MTTFKSREESVAAGYIRGDRIPYRGFAIAPVDISGTRGFGCCCAVGIQRDPNILGLETLGEGEDDRELENLHFGETETIWLSNDANRLRQPGCFIVRFKQEVWDEAVMQAKQAIDGWLERHPNTAAKVVAYETLRAKSQARQAAKRDERLARRATKGVTP